MTYFVDPYKKYYDTLSANTSIATESESISSKVSDIQSSFSSIKSALSSSSWKELGEETLANSTIPALMSSVSTLSNNIDSCLKACASAAINQLLPELTKLKEEDEKYEECAKKINELVIPVRYDSRGNETSEYRSYENEKSNLERELNTYRTNCEQYRKNCDSIVTSLKSFDKNVEEIKKPAVTSSGSSNLASSISIEGAASGGKVLKVTYNGKSFYVVNTKESVADYAKYVQQNGLCQNAGLLGSQCMVLSQYYAVDLMRGTHTSRQTMANMQGAPAPRINNRVSSTSQDAVLKYVYDEVTQGRPTVLQVTQRRSSEGLRHLVTVVGFDASVKSYQDLTPDKILVLDCVDGKIQTLSERNRNLFNQGGKYQALGATQTFLSQEVYTGSYRA